MAENGLHAFYRDFVEDVDGINQRVGDYVFGAVTGASYVTTTSPLRRRVDMLNQHVLVSMLLKQTMLSVCMLSVCAEDLQQMNRLSKAVNKLTAQIHLLHYVSSSNTSDTVTGIVLACLGSNKWSVYLPRLRIYTTFLSNETVNERSMSFKLYYFAREHDVKKKVRISPVL
jgi:outer membrane murein-binding lipoprotein Lpp